MEKKRRKSYKIIQNYRKPFQYGQIFLSFVRFYSFLYGFIRFYMTLVEINFVPKCAKMCQYRATPCPTRDNKPYTF